MYGYDSFQHYLEDMNRFPPMNEAADMAAEAATNEAFPDSRFDEESVKKSVEDAVLDKLRVKVTLWEQEILARRNWKGTIKKVAIKGIERTPVHRELRREAAEAVSKRSLREIDYGRVYNSAAKRWRKEAADAFKRGDSKAVLEAKQKETYNLVFYSEARKMVKLKERGEYLSKAMKKKTFQKAVTKVSVPLIDEINDAMGVLIFGRPPSKKDRSLGTPAALNHVERLTGEELEKLVLTFENLRKQARFLINEDKAVNSEKHEEQIADLTSNLEGVIAGLPKSLRGPVPAKKDETLARKARSLEMFFLKPETILMAMDEAKPLGKWWKAIYEPLDDARNDYYDEMQEVQAFFRETIKQYYTSSELRRFSEKTTKVGEKA